MLLIRRSSQAIFAPGLAAALLLACGGGGGSTTDSAVVDELANRLVQENSEHYAFGCADPNGSVLSNDPAPAALAREAEIEHVAASWAAESGGFVLAGDEDQEYIVVHDPASEATHAKEFERRKVVSGESELICLVPP